MITLKKHQIYAVNKASYYDRYAMFMDMGTGKTISSLYWAMVKGHKKILIVCMKSVIGHWFKEAEKVDNNGFFSDMYVTNYESLKRVKGKVFDTIIFDESTMIKNASTIRSRISLSLSKKAKCVMLLSALPAPHHFVDLYSQFKIMDPFNNPFVNKAKFWEDYYVNLKDIHHSKDIPEVWNPSKINIKQKWYMCKKMNIPARFVKLDKINEFKKHIQSRSVVVDKSILKLPSKEYITYDVGLNKEQKKLVDNLDSEHTMKYYSQMYRISGIPGGNKFNFLMDIINTLDEKIVVWCFFRSEIRNIVDHLVRLGVETDCIFGDTTGDRQSIIDEFVEGKTRVLVCNPAAAGIGTNFAPVRYAVYYSNSMMFEHRAQSEDRIHRIGQTDTAFIIDLHSCKADKIIKMSFSRGQDIQKFLKSNENTLI